MKEKLNIDLRGLTLKQLRCLQAAVKTGTLSGAARTLNVTPPAVTLQMQLLQEIAGLPLIERSSGGLLPTMAGAELLRTANRIEDMLDQSAQSLALMRGTAGGKVTVGVISTAKYFAPLALATFMKDHSDLDVRLKVGNRGETILSLQNYETDFAIMGNPPDYTKPSGITQTLVLPLRSGMQLGYLSDSSILGFALLNATGSKSNINILSTPQILTIDNHEAELNVGEEIPVVTNTRISESGTQFNTFDYKSVGVKLKITPHITKGGRITLDLYQEINTVLGDTTDTQVPPKLGKRDFKTKVTILDGKTIVIGGLIKNNKIVSETKVPILGDIPLLGWFFKHKSVSYSKSNLLVFITPHIVTKQAKIEKITEQKRNAQKRLKNY